MLHHYDLFIDTATNTIINSYAHTRQGYEDALRKIESIKASNKMINALIWSSKDDIVVFSTGRDVHELMSAII